MKSGSCNEADTAAQKSAEHTSSNPEAGGAVAAVPITSSEIEQEFDPELFQPIPPKQDCPICTLTLPLEEDEIFYMFCCGQSLCSGCMVEYMSVIDMTNEEKKNDRGWKKLQYACPFCREPKTDKDDVMVKQLTKRMVVNDTDAFLQMSFRCFEGLGVQKDESRGAELLFQAAELGSAHAYGKIASLHLTGKHGFDEDEAEGQKYLEEAAKRGSPLARGLLAKLESKNGNMRLAYKHLLILAAAGKQYALDEVKEGYKNGHVSKDEYADALRAFQKSRDAEESEERK